MIKYRKKPLIVEAFHMTRQARWDNADWPGWLHEAWNLNPGQLNAITPVKVGGWEGARVLDMLTVKTLVGDQYIFPGDWIVKGVEGELYPVSKSVFEASYEPVRSLPDWVQFLFSIWR